MEFTKCQECGIEFDNTLEHCPNCGHPKNRVVERKIASLRGYKKVRMIFRILCVLSLAFSVLFSYKAIDVKNNYYNSEDYSYLNTNAYVGGDAYNYIINGTYFTGYSVVASAGLVCMALFGSGALYSTLKIKEFG